MVGEFIDAVPWPRVGAYQALDVDGVDDPVLQVEVEIDARLGLDVHQIAVFDPLSAQRRQRRAPMERVVLSIRIDPEPVGVFRPLITGRLFKLAPRARQNRLARIVDVEWLDREGSARLDDQRATDAMLLVPNGGVAGSDAPARGERDQELADQERRV